MEPTRITDPTLMDVLEQLKSREPIFHRAEHRGRNEAPHGRGFSQSKFVSWTQLRPYSVISPSTATATYLCVATSRNCTT